VVDARCVGGYLSQWQTCSVSAKESVTLCAGD